MGMSTHLIAFIPDTDELYQKHKAVLLACSNAQIQELPKETAEYFGGTYPEEYLLEEKLKVPMKQGIHYTIINEDMVEGYEVELSQLPKGVTTLRFYNSY